MSDKTVQQFADMVKTPLDQLLTQLKEVGLSARTADDVLNDDQQMQLHSHLHKSHGQAQGTSDNSPKRVILERRKVTEIKQASVPGSSTKTISVELRKKKTYIKRPETEEQPPVETTHDFAEQSNTPEMITASVEIETTSPVTTEVQVEQVAPVVEETLSVIESVATLAVVEQSQPEIEAKAGSNDKKNHVIPNIDLDTESESLIEPEKDSGSEAEFKDLDTEEDKITTVEERAIESVDNTATTFKPEIMLFDVNITETSPLVLSDLSLEQLVDTYAQVDQQSQLLKGLILLEARNRFPSNNDFGKWVESVGTLCSDSRQVRTRYMNFAEYFKDKSYTGISLTCCYEISAPINADVADQVYDYALNKKLSVAQVKEKIQIAKGLLPSNVNETTEESKAPELLPPEDMNRFKEQILLDIEGLAQHDAIRVLKACMTEVKNKSII